MTFTGHESINLIFEQWNLERGLNLDVLHLLCEMWMNEFSSIYKISKSEELHKYAILN